MLATAWGQKTAGHEGSAEVWMRGDYRDTTTLRRKVATIDQVIVWFLKFHESPLFTRALRSVTFESAELLGLIEKLEITQNC